MGLQDLWVKNGVFRGKIGEGVGRYWPPTNSFLLLGVYTSVSKLVKVDEEMRPWGYPQTDRHTHAQTQNDFIICPICYSYGADKMVQRATWRVVWDAGAYLSLRGGQLGSHLLQGDGGGLACASLALEVLLERGKLQLEPGDLRLVRPSTRLRLFVTELPLSLALFEPRGCFS